MIEKHRRPYPSLRVIIQQRNNMVRDRQMKNAKRD
jgi:hypothetical protein